MVGEQKRTRWDKLLPKLTEDKYHLVYHPNQKNVSVHDHPFLELSYIWSGTVEHTINGQISVLHQGDYFLVDYGCRHAYRAVDGRPFANLDCLFLPELLDPVLKNAGSLEALFEHYLLHFNMRSLTEKPGSMIFHDSDGKIRQLLEKMQAENEKRQPGFAEMIRCYLIEILLHTVRNIDDASIASQGHGIVSYLTAYVANHYMEPVSLRALAENMGYSLPYVSKRFKEETGSTFVNYLQNHRVKQASRLLITTERSLSEISEMVGYRDVKFFTERFKAITGITPAAFRKINRK